MNKARAIALTAKIKGNIEELESNLQMFIDHQAWLAMDYKSFTAWWDAEIGQLRLGGAIKNAVVSLMLLEQVGLPTKRGPSAVYTRSDISEMKALRSEGNSVASIAKKFGVDRNSIYRALSPEYQPSDEKYAASIKAIGSKVGVDKQTVAAIKAREQIILGRKPPEPRWYDLTQSISIRIPREMHRKLSTWAKKKSMTKADVFRIALEEFARSRNII